MHLNESNMKVYSNYLLQSQEVDELDKPCKKREPLFEKKDEEVEVELDRASISRFPASLGKTSMLGFHIFSFRLQVKMKKRGMIQLNALGAL